MSEGLFNIDYCSDCPLRGSVKVLGEGKIGSRLMIVGEAPGEEEVRYGRPFIGRSGQLLRDVLCRVGIKEEDCYITNAVLCHPPSNRTPTRDEINRCKYRLKKVVMKIQPKMILALGNTATYALLSLIEEKNIKSNVGIERVRGSSIFIEEFGCRVFFTYHPAAILRDPYKYRPFYEDLLLVSHFLGSGGIVEVKHDYRKLISLESILNTFNMFINVGEVALDIETTGLDAWTDEIVCMAFSCKENEAFWLPTKFYKDGKYWTDKDWYEVKEMLVTLLNSNIKVIVHNEPFESLFFKTKFGIDLNVYFDTLLAHHLLDENSPHGLKTLSTRYPDVVGYADNIIYTQISELDEESLMKYNCADVDVTYRLYKEFNKELEKEGLSGLFFDIVIPARRVLTKMEYRGVKVDESYMKSLEETWLKQISEIEEKIYQMIGERINLNSSQQLSELLFKKLGFESTKKTLKGNQSVDNEVIKNLATKSEVVKLILEYRKIQKLLSTYVVGLRKRINPITKRVHTEYLMHGTVTGRLSSRNPNLQNIPRGEEAYSLEVHKCFVPSKEDWVIMEFDYKQLEYRVLLAYIKDDEMIKRIREGLDIHRFVASRIFKKPSEEVNDRERFIAKIVVFGLLYGMGENSLARELGVSKEEAQVILKSFFEMHDKMLNWMNERRVEVKRKKYVTSLLGRRRRLYAIDSEDEGIASKAERQAINFPIQSLASDLTLSALVKIWNELERRGFEARPILIIHDAIVVESPRNEKEEVKKIVIDIMKQPLGEDFILPSYVPLDVDVKEGESWV